MDIETPLDPGNYSFEHIVPWCAGPSIKTMLVHTETTLTFDGYFRVETELPTSDRPIRRILNYRGESYLIAITGMKRGPNTSVYFEDPFEGGNICLTPTEIIEIEYHVLEAKIPSSRYYDVLFAICEEEKALRETNETLHFARMDEEIAERRKSRNNV